MASDAQPLLRDLFVRPDFDNARVIVTFTTPRGFRRGSWKITAGSNTLGAGRIGRKRRAQFEVKLPGFTPWTIENPFLYRLAMVLDVGGRKTPVVQPFGMRKFHVANKQIYLNNAPFYIRGVVRGREAHDHPNFSGMSETEYYAKFILAAKKLGFNFIRFHSRVPSEAYFEAADCLGVLTHVEVRKYYGKYQKERELMDQTRCWSRPGTGGRWY